MPDSVALVTVVNGAAYERFADEMFESAARHFRPVSAEMVSYVMLAGRPGWPDATLYRYHVLREHWERLGRFTHVYLIDADMRFEGPVGPEILPPEPGIVATLHPGYVGAPVEALPYERRPQLHAKVSAGKGRAYYAGGFVGGTAADVARLARKVAWRIDEDAEQDNVAVWHDESNLNSVLVTHPPALELTPAYCHPDNDAHYVANVWKEPYHRLIVALDKSSDVRGDRA